MEQKNLKPSLNVDRALKLEPNYCADFIPHKNPCSVLRHKIGRWIDFQFPTILAGFFSISNAFGSNND